ncbi:MAG: BatA domain-containing protein [Phycisphaeraceae bacterium]|nr:BatA domain-containing protein [Phycisphaeraceae bacterium]
MTFLHPSLALLGASLIAIPILIHLLARRRKKPVKWGAMRFLVEAYKKQRKRMTLEQLILLATRCLVLLLLALALGRPALQAAGLLGEGSGRTIYLVLDNAAASQTRDGSAPDAPRALDRHKAAARDILAALAPGDRAALVTLGAPYDAIVVPPSIDPGAVATLVDRVEPTDSAADLAGAFSAVAAELERAALEGTAGARAEAVVVVLSDFLAGTLDAGAIGAGRADEPGAPGPSTGGAIFGPRVRLAATTPATSGVGNVQILAVEPLRSVVLTGASTPGAADPVGASNTEQVRVRLRRTGPLVSEAGVTTLTARLVAAGSAASGPLRDLAPPVRTTVRWAPGQAEQTVSVLVEGFAEAARAGRAAAIVAQIDRDALDADNIHRAPVRVRSALRIAIIDRRRFTPASSVADLDAGDWLRLALRPSEGALLETSTLSPNSVDEPSLAGLDAVFLPRPDLLDDAAWTRLRAFADAGGMVVVAPPAEATVHLWPDAMARAFDLSLRIAREPSTHETPLRLAAEQPATRALELLRAELPELARPVTLSRTLDVEDAGPSSTTLLTRDDGASWLVSFEPNPANASDNDARSRGLLVYLASAVSLEWTDLPARPLMVPLLQELVRQGVGLSTGDSSTIAGASILAPARSAELRVLSSDAPDQRAIPLRDNVAPPARRAALLHALDANGAERGLLAVNADTGASRTDANDPALVRAWLARALPPGAPEPVFLDPPTAAATLARADQGSPISLPLLIAALALAALETVLARLFSHAQQDRAALASTPEAAA